MTNGNNNGNDDTSTLGDGVLGRDGSFVESSIEDSTLYTVFQLLNRPKPATTWFWGDGPSGVLPADSIAALAGYTSEGKTTLAFHLVAAAVDGRPFLEWPTMRIKKALIVTETDEIQSRELFEAAAVSPEGQRRISVYGGQPTAEQLEGMLSVFRPEILVLDSLTSIAPGLGLHGGSTFDWYAPTHITSVMLWVRSIRQLYGIRLVLVLAHSVKPPRDREGKRLRLTPTAADVRGSGSVLEQADTSYVIVPTNGEACGYLARVKRRRAGTLEKVEFKYDVGSGVFMPTRLSDEVVLKAVQDGHTSREGVARYLHFRSDDVRQTINRLIGEGKLTEPTSGKLKNSLDSEGDEA